VQSRRGPTRIVKSRQCRRLKLSALVGALSAFTWLAAYGQQAQQRLDGFDVIATADHPFGGAAARQSLARAKSLGARAIAVTPFLWQPAPASPALARGSDMSDSQLRAAIRDARALGLEVVVKPHLWVPQRWAGVVAMTCADDWRIWFANYRRELQRIAAIASEEGAGALAVGTELSATTQRREWAGVIAAARALFKGRLFYFAHNLEEAREVPFWQKLDAVGVTLYPPLGSDGDSLRRRATMRAIAEGLDQLAAQADKPVVVGEVGLRSAVGAAAKPWESVEERVSTPDPALQAAVIADWLATLNRPAVGGVLIWRWFTDPRAGGMNDTDFTVQGKPAERVLACVWKNECGSDSSATDFPSRF
jgi:hypothetical protein